MLQKTFLKILFFYMLLAPVNVYSQSDELKNNIDTFVRLTYQESAIKLLPDIKSLKDSIINGSRQNAFLEIVREEYEKHFSNEEIIDLIDYKQSKVGQKEEKVNNILLPQALNSMRAQIADVLLKNKNRDASFEKDEIYFSVLKSYIKLSRPTNPNEIEFNRGLYKGLYGDLLNIDNTNSDSLSFDDKIMNEYVSMMFTKIYKVHYSLEELKKLINYHEKEALQKHKELNFSILIDSVKKHTEKNGVYDTNEDFVIFDNIYENPTKYSSTITREHHLISEKIEDLEIYSVNNDNLSTEVFKYESVINQIDSSILKIKKLSGFSGNIDYKESSINYWEEVKKMLEFEHKYNKILLYNFSFRNLKTYFSKGNKIEEDKLKALVKLQNAQKEFFENFNIQIKFTSTHAYTQEFIIEVNSYGNSILLTSIEPLIIMEQYEMETTQDTSMFQMLTELINSSNSSLESLKKIGFFESDSMLYKSAEHFLTHLNTNSKILLSGTISCNFEVKYQSVDKEIEALNKQYKSKNLSVEDSKLLNRLVYLMDRALEGKSSENMLVNFDESIGKIDRLLRNFNFEDKDLKSRVDFLIKETKNVGKDIKSCQNYIKISEKTEDSFMETDFNFNQLLDESDKFLKRHIKESISSLHYRE